MSTPRQFIAHRIAPLVILARVHAVALGIVAGLLLLYAVFGFFFVPRIARAQIESYVTEQLHRQVEIGEIRFNPFFFDASIAGLSLREADGSPLVSVRHLYVNAELASLWQLAVVLKEVQVVAPFVDLIIAGDGSVNLAQLVPESPEAPAEEESRPPRVRIGTLTVEQGRVGFTDNTREQPFTAAVAPIKFVLSDFRTDAGYENAYAFAGATLSGERLEWSGEFTVQPLGSSGRFRIQDLKAATLDAYAAETLPFQLASGQASLAGNYRLAMTPSLALDVALPLLQVRDFSMKERGSTGAAPLKASAVDLHEVAFFYDKRVVGVKRIDVKGAHVDVAREADGSISLMRLFGDATTESAPPVTALVSSGADDPAPEDAREAAAQWRIHADTIQLSEAAILAEDRSVTPIAKFAFAPLALTINGWSTDAAAKAQIDADVTINESGRLLGQGELQLEPLGAQVAMELTDFDLPAIQPYLATTTAMTLHSGRLGVKGDVSYGGTPASAPPLKFTGEMQVAGLRTTDQLVNEDFIKWRSLAVSGIEFTQNPGKLSIDRIVARQPYGRIVIAEDTSLNVTKVLSPPGTSGQQEAQGGTDGRDGGSPPESSANSASNSGQPPFPIRIKTVQVIDGAANFADYSIEPSFSTGILELNGAVTGLSSNPASRAKVKLDGKVDRYAPVNIRGEVNLLSAAKYTDVAMNFRNMELTTFNPYSGKFAGYNISKGKLSTELQYVVEDRKLDAAHHIVIDNLEFGAKTDSKDAAPIPLKLAVALLKDRRGVIDVNVPVSGSLDNPEFRLGPVIWKAFVGLLTKVVTAPFAALGALFGGGEELGFVEFAAGSAVLPVSETDQLNNLAQALIERPELRLSIPLTVTAQDGEAMARAALAEKLPAGTSDSTREPPADDAAKRKRIALLENVYREVAKAAPAYPGETEINEAVDLDARLKFLERSLLDRLRPADATLTSLAQQRARAVQNTLLANTELSPERVFITADRSEGKAEGDSVRMELELE